MANLLWLQSGACSGDTMSLLNAEDPDLLTALQSYNINLLWHPSLSVPSPKELGDIIDEILADQIQLDFFCLEGSVLTGPEGTGMFDTFLGRPKKDVIESLSYKAHFTMAMGTCSSYGGIPASGSNPTDAIGLQFDKKTPGGLLGENFRSPSGFPVINMPGCPTHPNTMIQTLINLVFEGGLELDELNRPKSFYSTIVHQGCTRNEYHEYDVEETAFGGLGCLFFNLGCQGPRTMATCNSILWNRQKSKPRAGVPCVGCTSPLFPLEKNLLETDKIGTIPVKLPLGVNRANYMAYKGLAKAATPQRLLDRKLRL